MAINKICVSQNDKLISFKSLRTDINEIKELRDGTRPILDNKSENIRSALNRFAEHKDNEQLAELLDIADKLQYGVLENSEFNDAIEKDFDDVTKGEQTQWGVLLRDTIESAINGINSDSLKEELQTRFEEVFAQKRPLTNEQKRILKERENIISLVDQSINSEDIDTIAQSATIKKNLNYFIMSPEISESQKIHCLSMIKYFLSDEYKINPQLADKKLQALDEILNDITIKTPESPILQIKAVDQRQSGICAAISVCRKALAYEDKVRYLEIILNELDNSDFMEVFDITDIKAQKKVKSKKAYIDYNDALSKGYRIIDASAHNWMQLAGSVGNGETNVQYYKAFDRENYEVFRDSTWYKSLPEDKAQKQLLLRCLIKEQEAMESLSKSQKVIEESENVYKNTFNKNVNLLGNIKESLIKEITSYLPKSEQNQARKLATGLIKFYQSKDDQGRPIIADKMSDDTKNSLVYNYLISELSSTEEHGQLKANIEKIRKTTELYIDTSIKNNEIRTPKTLSWKYQYYKKLFEAATSHRLSLENDLEIPETLTLFERQLNLPTREEQILAHLSNEIKALSNKKGKEKEIEALTEDMLFVSSFVPSKINDILKLLINKDTKGILDEYIYGYNIAINSGNEDIIKSFAQNNNIKATKKDTLKYLSQLSQQLEKNNSNKAYANIIRAMGFEDEIDFIKKIYANYISMLENSGITEEELKHIERTMQMPFTNAIEKIRKEIIELDNNVSEIEKDRMVPSRKALVLKTLEKNGLVQRRQTLDKLEQKFNSISDGMIKNSKIKNPKERKKQDDKLLHFSEEEKEFFKSIDSQSSKMRKYSNSRYRELNSELREDLDELYGEIGRLEGHFWLPEEGGSGLYSNQIIRIIEQITGKPYYIEHDLTKAVEQIKRGNSSGITGTHVDGKDFSMHAQYVKAITKDIVYNRKTKQREEQEILWHDNSWGCVEDENSWTDKGIGYTDYGRGFGGESGYILNKNFSTGTPVITLANELGHSKKYDEDYALFNDIILQGNSPELAKKLLELISYVYDVNDINDNIEKIETAIKQGKKIDTKRLQEIDEIAYKELDKIKKRIKNEIKSEADFDKLANDDPLKIYMQKLALYMALPTKESKNDIDEVFSSRGIKKLAEKLFKEQIDKFDDFFNKTPDSYDYIGECCKYNAKDYIDELKRKTGKDYSEQEFDEIINKIFDIENIPEIPTGTLENIKQLLLHQAKSIASNEIKDSKEKANALYEVLSKLIVETIDKDIRITSLDSPMLKNSMYGQIIIKAFDEHYQPKTDKELIAILQDMQNMEFDDYTSATEWLTYKDVGLNYITPYEYINKLHAQNEDVEDALNEIILGHIIAKNIPSDSPESQYRQLLVLLSDMNVDNYIKDFKEQMFTKYKIRSAFPKPIIYSDKEIYEASNKLIAILGNNITEMSDYQTLIKLTEICQQMTQIFEEDNISKVSKQFGNKVQLSPDNLTKLKELTSNFIDISEGDIAHKDLYLTAQRMSEHLENGDIIKAMKEYLSIKSYFDSIPTDDAGLLQNSYNAINEIKQDSKTAINEFVLANIVPKHQNDVHAKIKEFKKLGLKSDTQALEVCIQELKDMIIKYHISREPITLLNTYIKYLSDKNIPESVIGTLKLYLEEATRTAELTKIEYRLVEYENKGYATKTKEILDELRLFTESGKYSSISSPEGLQYFMNSMTNNTNDNRTLKLFLTQTGLSESALNTLIENFNIEKRIELYDVGTEIICREMRAIDTLMGITKNFFEKNQMKFRNFNIALEQLKKYLKANQRKFNSEGTQIIDKYIEYINNLELNEDYKNNEFAPDVITLMLNSLNGQLIAHFTEELNEQIRGLKEAKESYINILSLIDTIEVSPNSETVAKRDELFKQIPTLTEKEKEVWGKIKQLSDSLTYLKIV